MKECCANCRRRYKLVKFDYSRGGCEHTEMDGYICMAFAYANEAVWMVGKVLGIIGSTPPVIPAEDGE